MNEIRILKKSLMNHITKNSLPYKYTFVVTNLCNSHCKTCNIWKTKKNILKKELTCKDILKTIKNVSNEIYWLNFTGGEPLLKNDFFSLINESYDLCKNLSIINIPSNGLLPEREKQFDYIAKHCKKTNIYVTLSLDGMGNEHDFIRGTKGAYKKVIKSYKILKEIENKNKNFKVNFQLTLSRYNNKTAYETFKLIKKMSDTPIVTLAHEAKLFNNIKKIVEINSDESIAETIQKIYSEYDTKKIQNFLPKIYLKLLKKFVIQKKSSIPCSAGKSTITIFPDGTVYACPYSNFFIGNIKDQNFDLSKMIKKEKIKNILKKVSKCNCCWQNCEAFPTIINHPIQAVYNYLRK